MKLSACYIVRDEAEELARSIASLGHAYDELIVVQTIEDAAVHAVAARYGARTHLVPWQDNFSLPRNEALRLAQGDWILFLDADESFRESGDVRARIEEVISRHPAAEGILLPRSNIESATGEEVTRDLSLRLFRHAADIVYHGRVHENACHDDGRLLRLAEAGASLTLLHTGYARAAGARKGDRNLVLMQREIAERGEIPRYDAPMAESYFGKRMYREAADYARRALVSDVRAVVPDSSIHHVLIESLRQIGAPLGEQLAAAEQAVADLPEFPELWGELGMVLCGLGRLQEAEAAFQRALALYAQPRNISHRSGYMTPAIAALLRRKLAEIAQVMEGGQKMAQAVRIFAGYIAKQEDADLRRSLASLRASVDGIVVCHTTQAAAGEAERAAGAEVFYSPWQEDFAAARNEVLARVRGRCDWLVFLDADESLSEETRGNLRRVIAQADATAEALLIPLANIDEDDGGKMLDQMLVLRAFRMRPDIQYVGKIHEELRHSDGRPLLAQRVGEEELLILHTGYSAHRRREKARRNLELLQREMAETRHPERLYHYFADIYFAMDQAEEAERYARLDIAQGRQPRTDAAKSYRMLLQIVGKQPERRAEYATLVRDAVRDYPELPEFHAELANVRAEAGAWDDAIREMETALSLLGKPQEGREISLFPPELAETARRQLASWKRRRSLPSAEERLAALAQAEGRLIMALLFLDDTCYAESRAREELPHGVRLVLDAQHGEAADVAAAADDYLSVLEVVLLCRERSLWARYADLARHLPRPLRLRAAARFEGRGAMREAAALYETLREEPGKPADVWLHHGICAYRLGERETARRNLAAIDAAQCGERERCLLAAYRAWCGEGGETI